MVSRKVGNFVQERGGKSSQDSRIIAKEVPV